MPRNQVHIEAKFIEIMPNCKILTPKLKYAHKACTSCLDIYNVIYSSAEHHNFMAQNEVEAMIRGL